MERQRVYSGRGWSREWIEIVEAEAIAVVKAAMFLNW